MVAAPRSRLVQHVGKVLLQCRIPDPLLAVSGAEHQLMLDAIRVLLGTTASSNGTTASTNEIGNASSCLFQNPSSLKEPTID
jgi:hypothetical protein